jgi:cyclic dehypoxanthinyl futalosine synthase
LKTRRSAAPGQDASMKAIYQPAESHPHLSGLDSGLLASVAAGAARLTPEQALEIFHRMPTAELGRWADARCRDIHGDTLRTYVIDRNINYTNVCTARCTFCAFRRDADDHDAYTLGYEELLAKIAELVAIGGTQILMQGGMNPHLPLDWYLGLLAAIKERFPRVHVHAFSPPEMIEFVNFFDPPGDSLFEKVRWVLKKLKAAGMDSLPGGGGEIFAGPVRRKIGLGKCDQEAWLTTMYAAHSVGLFTSASMMFGHIEGHADRIHHMRCVREWQDRALAGSEAGEEDGVGGPFGHYKAFISWPFQRENTPLGRVKDWGTQPGDEGEFPGDAVANLTGDGDAKSHPEFGRRLRMSGAVDYLRTQAVSRLFLDNVYSIGASWVTMGPHVGQTGLAFGANDMGSVMMEENVVSAAGTTYCMDEPVLCRLIRDAGFVPAQRNNTYDILRVHEGARSPDLAVTDWSEHRLRKLHVQRKESAGAALTIGASER